MSATADKQELRGHPESNKAPRPGIKIAVIRTPADTDLLAYKSLRVKFGQFFVDSVYVGGDTSPLFVAVRNPWEITAEDDRTKQTAWEFLANVDLSILPEDLRGMVEIFRQEQQQKVNYSLRTFNIDRARIPEEECWREHIPGASYFLLTPEYRPGSHAK
ncbi:MAG TPA: hypothetical protein VMR59_01355 [Patescibacteria group bacterium]|jgi:hypothetical protein|nr:hypothetical protein [Patescibacteria group bacterium]